jgi:hypothetical protein
MRIVAGNCALSSASKNGIGAIADAKGADPELLRLLSVAIWGAAGKKRLQMELSSVESQKFKVGEPQEACSKLLKRLRKLRFIS